MAKSGTFTRKQLKYIEFLANPEKRRTKVQFAQDIGVSLRTLFRWQEKEGFSDAVYELAMFYLGTDLPQVLSDMRRASRKGSVDAMKLILQQTGKLRKEPEQEVRVVLSWDEEDMASSGAC